MNISPINSTTKYNQNTSFKSGALISSVFMEINKHEIIGVSAIDLLSMVIPRSIIDFTRNKEAGIETAIRESSSTATHAAIGVAGLGAGALLAQTLKHKNYGVDLKSINANYDTINGMAKTFKTIVDNNPDLKGEELSKAFLTKVFEDVKGLAGNTQNGDKNVWYSLKSANQNIGSEVVNTKNSIIEILLQQQKKSSSYKLPTGIMGKLETYLNLDIPSTQELKVTLAGKEVSTHGNHFLSDAYALSKAFAQENVIQSFKNANDALDVAFVKDLKKLSSGKTALGLAAICAVALSMQTINRNLTRIRTGRSGFVGDPDYMKKKKECDMKKAASNDKTFYPLKALAVLAMGFYIFKTINAKNLRDFASKIQFKGSLPTMEQIKLVYGSTILGRLFAASDKNELRESAFRDFLGFTNFLVLGALVTKCFVNWKDKSLINYDEATHGKGLWNWLKNSSVKTHQEVINSELKTNVLTEDGTRSLKELYRNNWIKSNGKLAEKLGVLNKAKLLGMGYACVALGIFVPLINKYMTERKHAKAGKILSAVMNKQTEPTPTAQKTQEIIDNFLNKKAV